MIDIQQPKTTRTFICADGRTINVNGQKRKTMEMLILHRMLGIGLRKGAHTFNVEEVLCQLVQEEGVLIGKLDKRYCECIPQHFGSDEDYFYALESWYPKDELDPSGFDVDAQSGAHVDLPEEWPFNPFLESGNIGSELDINILEPAQKLPKGGMIMLRRDLDNAMMAMLSLSRRFFELEGEMLYHECS